MQELFVICCLLFVVCCLLFGMSVHRKKKGVQLGSWYQVNNCGKVAIAFHPTHRKSAFVVINVRLFINKQPTTNNQQPTTIY